MNEKRPWMAHLESSIAKVMQSVKKKIKSNKIWHKFEVNSNNLITGFGKLRLQLQHQNYQVEPLTCKNHKFWTGILE